MFRNIDMHLRPDRRKSHVGDEACDQGMFVRSILLTDESADDVVDTELPWLGALRINVPRSISVQDETETALCAAGWQIVEGDLCGDCVSFVPFDAR